MPSFETESLTSETRVEMTSVTSRSTSMRMRALNIGASGRVHGGACQIGLRDRGRRRPDDAAGRMGTELSYLGDGDAAYVRSFRARIVALPPGAVVLNRTYFYPVGGGQPADRGVPRLPGGGRAPDRGRLQERRGGPPPPGTPPGGGRSGGRPGGRGGPRLGPPVPAHAPPHHPAPVERAAVRAQGPPDRPRPARGELGDPRPRAARARRPGGARGHRDGPADPARPEPPGPDPPSAAR